MTENGSVVVKHFLEFADMKTPGSHCCLGCVQTMLVGSGVCQAGIRASLSAAGSRRLLRKEEQGWPLVGNREDSSGPKSWEAEDTCS